MLLALAVAAARLNTFMVNMLAAVVGPVVAAQAKPVTKVPVPVRWAAAVVVATQTAAVAAPVVAH